MSRPVTKLAKRVARFIIGRPILGRSILCYHRVAKADFDPFNIAVTPEEFERQLTRLRRKTVLPLLELLRLHLDNRLPRDAVAITFDDGYACNALVAAPMLETFGYPASYFIVAEAITGQQEFWWDDLEGIIHAPGFDYATAVRLAGPNADIAPATEGDLSAYLALWQHLLEKPAEARRHYLDCLRSEIGSKKEVRSTHRPMTAAELRKLAANSLFEIGGHTVTHPSLTSLTAAGQEREILDGARFLTDLLGKPVRSFAYPFGHWSRTTCDILSAAGFECAVTTQHTKVRRAANRFELPRRQALSPHARML